VMDQTIFAHAIFNQLEGRWNGSNPQFRWDGQGWIGTDYDKLWIKSEGTLQSNGTVDDGQQQFLYSRAVTTYFDLQGGLRSDIDSHSTRNWGAFGIQGLAPYFFDLEVTGFVSGEGHFAARLETSYDLLLTQRLILQPQIEFNIYSKADPARLVGAGFSDIDTGLRLRYELSRTFAPYLGVVYEGKFGRRRILRGKLVRARVMCASFSAFAPGSERGHGAHCYRHSAHCPADPSSGRGRCHLFRCLRCGGHGAALARYSVASRNGARSLNQGTSGRHRRTARARRSGEGHHWR